MTGLWERTWVVTAAKSVFAGLALVLLFTTVPPAAVMEAFERVSILPILGAATLLVPQLAGRVLRWHILLRHAGGTASRADLTRTILAGYAFSAVTPAEAGDVMVRLNLQTDLPRATVLGLTLVDKAVHFGTMLVVGLPSAVLIVTGREFLALSSFVLLLSAGVGAVFALRHLAGLSLGPARWLQRIQRTAHAISVVPRRALVEVAAVSFTLLSVIALQEYAVLNALVPVTGSAAWHGFWAGIAIRALLPFFVGDLGIREATHVFFFGKLGVAGADAMSASLIMFALNVVIPATVGLLLFVRRGSRP